jgi:hypothetical protein
MYTSVTGVGTMYSTLLQGWTQCTLPCYSVGHNVHYFVKGGGQKTNVLSLGAF